MRRGPTQQFLFALVALPLLGLPLVAAMDMRRRAPLIVAGGAALLLGLLALRSHRHERRLALGGDRAGDRPADSARSLRFIAGTLTVAVVLTLLGVALLGLGVLRRG